MAPMPNGSNIKAPAMTVDASGTGAGTGTGLPPGAVADQDTDGEPSVALAPPKVGPYADVKDTVSEFTPV